MPAEAWVALVVGIFGIIGSTITATWYLGGKLSRQDTEMNGIKAAIVKLEAVIELIAVDRERQTMLDKRVSKLEQWYDELRRGVGRIS